MPLGGPESAAERAWRTWREEGATTSLAEPRRALTGRMDLAGWKRRRSSIDGSSQDEIGLGR